MMLLLTLLVGCASSTTPEEGLRSTRGLLSLFQEYQDRVHHNYDASEAPMRLKIFRKSLQKIVEINSQNRGWTAGLTWLADLTEAEMDQFRGLNASEAQTGRLGNPILGSPINWRTRGAVTPVKNQMGNSCWTFATVTCIEALFHGLTGNLIDFADQELMDCVYPTPGNRDGRGHYLTAFNWIRDNDRLGLRSEAGHTGQDGPCNYGGATNAMDGYQVTGYLSTPNGENGLLAGLAQGPVAVAIQTSGSQLYLYGGGTFTPSTCGDSADHAVTAVGYTSTTILIKNSWGTANWGDQGYAHWARGHAGHNCALYSHGAYPLMTVAKKAEREE